MAIGQIIYNNTPDLHAKLDNTDWAGTFGFSLLGGSSPYKTFRLYQHGDINTFDTLGDLKEILYAVYSYQKALTEGYIAAGSSFIQILINGLAVSDGLYEGESITLTE